MAVFSGYPQSVNFSTVNMTAGGGSENLLINPRGKINQAGENDGVLSAGQYFCDGWKAGAAGAEVYIDPDGFRLISGSILQLVPNNLEAGRVIRGNMDALSGAPSISINGGTDNELSDTAEYIQFEVSGDNSKFTRLILAESNSLPIYQQTLNELSPCLRFFENIDFTLITNNQTDRTHKVRVPLSSKANIPAITRISSGNATPTTQGTRIDLIDKDGFYISKLAGDENIDRIGGVFIADARP